MRKFNLLSRLVLGSMAVVMALGLLFTLATADTFAAPAAAPTTPGQDRVTRCEERKENLIAKLERLKGDVQKRIDDLKARIARADDAKVKQKLEQHLDRAQKHLDKINDHLQKLRDHKCQANPGARSGQATPAPTPATNS